MNSFIKCYAREDIKTKMIILYALNFTDIIFTLFLCSTGYFIEANPFVAIFAGNTILALLAKSAVPAILLVFLYLRMRKATDQQMKKANIIIISLLLVYTFINVSHIFWLSIYIFKPSVLNFLV